jgi:hypothetical protein
VIGPLWGAAAFDFYGVSAPFLTAALGIGLAFLIALRLQRPTEAVTSVASDAEPAGPAV